MYSLESIEKKQNIKLPEEYKQLYQSNFNGIGNRIKIYAGEDLFYISKFLTVTEINDLLEEFYDFFGYDVVPIAETDFDDYICLRYRENRENPSIVYWNYELALENPEEGIYFLYNSMYEFESTIKQNSSL